MGALVLIGAGVVFAREGQLRRGAGAAEPTLTEIHGTATPPSTPRPAATPQPAAEPTVAVARPAAPKPTAVPVVVKPNATSTAAAARATATAATAIATAAATSAGSRAVAAPTRSSAGTAGATAIATATSVATATAGMLALTFDAGADRGYAQDILDTLAEEHLVASFGITGVWAKANPDLVKRMAADGHLVINHTLDHHSFTGVSDKLGGLSPAKRRQELDDADAIIAPLVGHSLKPYYRLPYGDDDAQVAADVLPAGYSHKVGWTVDSLGWRGASATDIVARCLKLAASGGIYVFHVGHASQDSIALAPLIHALRERGFGFQRVDQG